MSSSDIVGSILDETGLRAKLKSELRYQLIESLRKQQKIDFRNAKSDLREKALFSAVLELLQKRGKLYSLSVLTPECGLKETDIFSKQDICKALGLEAFSFCEAGGPPSGSPMDIEEQGDGAGRSVGSMRSW